MTHSIISRLITKAGKLSQTKEDEPLALLLLSLFVLLKTLNALVGVGCNVLFLRITPIVSLGSSLRSLTLLTACSPSSLFNARWLLTAVILHTDGIYGLSHPNESEKMSK